MELVSFTLELVYTVLELFYLRLLPYADGLVTHAMMELLLSRLQTVLQVRLDVTQLNQLFGSIIVPLCDLLINNLDIIASLSFPFNYTLILGRMTLHLNDLPLLESDSLHSFLVNLEKFLNLLVYLFFYSRFLLAMLLPQYLMRIFLPFKLLIEL